MFLDKLREKCGVFGVFGHKDAATLTALGFMHYNIEGRKEQE